MSITLKIFLGLTLVLFTSKVGADDDDFSEFHDDGDVLQSSSGESKEKSGYQSSTAGASKKSSHLQENKSTSTLKQAKSPPSNASPKVFQAQSTDDNVSRKIVDKDDVSHLNDSDEFEGYDEISAHGNAKPNLTIVKVPHHLTTSWDNYYLEMLMLAGLAIYLLNFGVGRTKNARIVNAWFSAHKELLYSNFALIGDDGSSGSSAAEFVKNGGTGCLTKEAENIYTLWCTGRASCESMLVELKLLKRQDLVSTIARWLKPVTDQITIKITVDDAEMEGFALAIVTKKRVQSLLKEYSDLNTFCADKRAPRQGLPQSYVVLSELPEVSSAILDAVVCKIFRDFEDIIESLHISDQYVGPKIPQDEQQCTKIPEVKKVIIFTLKVGRKGLTNVADVENIVPILSCSLHILDRIHRVKLNKEVKLKSEKNRAKAMDNYEKLVHSQRQEAAQQRREEKRRIEKERLLAEEDPEKARRLEILDQKKEAKRKQPKLKMLKVKGI